MASFSWDEIRLTFSTNPNDASVLRGAGAKAGTEIWRIENKVPVCWPPSKHGQFFSGDSYLVLKTKEPKNGGFEWDLYFWLGKDSSIDEMGIAAIKAVELDDSLGGGPIQYREVQEHESDRFRSLFKKGLIYLDGGVESGFRKVGFGGAAPSAPCPSQDCRLTRRLFAAG